MKYKLIYTKRAAKDIQSLDRLAKKRLAKKLIWLAKDPIKRSVKLTNSELGEYRFRIGDYRIVFDIAGSEVVVLRVGHRKEIYR